MKLHRKILRRLVPPELLSRINQISHLEDRLYELEARAARLAEAALRPRYLAAFAGSPSEELQVFSQNGEDGLLLWLLRETGSPRKTFAEIGIENGRECNTAILGFVLGWSGVWFDADPLGVAAARRMIRVVLKNRPNRIEVHQVRVTRENIDGLLGADELGVLSIDVDGMDYWLWAAVERSRPRIVILEYNASFGPDRRITVPYRPDFRLMEAHPTGYYHGASLAALEVLSKKKGYSLVAVCSAGVNAFFVREDIRPPSIPQRTAAEVFRPHAVRNRAHSLEQQWDLIRHLPYESV